MATANWFRILFQVIILCALMHCAFGDTSSSNSNRRVTDVMQEQREMFSRRLNDNSANAISIISAATLSPNRIPVTTIAADPHNRLSYKCLAYEIGRSNGVEVKFRFVKKHSNATFFKFYEYSLALGNVNYTANSTTKGRAEELASYIAVNTTKLPMPHDAIDKCTTRYSAIVLVHEWAQYHKSNVAYNVLEEKGDGTRPIFVMECFIPPNLRTHAEAGDKKSAKLKAAERMLPLLPMISITDNLVPIKVEEAVDMHPVSRLNEIQLERKQKEPIYHLRNDLLMSNEMGQPSHLFIMEVRVGDVIMQGTGKTVRAAKADASAKMLRLMNLPVAVAA